MYGIYKLMYITAVPHRNSPPALLLRDSFRDGDKVRTRTLANLTSWAPERIEALRRAPMGFYDVTSSYFEGACHALAAFGYTRDNKAGKTQIVIGLVTTGTGEPFAVHVFDGTTSDPLTGPAPVETLRTRFGLTEGVCVGDRGMVKRTGKTVLAAAGSKSITALPPPQVRKLLREDVVRPEWFTSHVHPVQHGPVRLVLRRSEAVRCKAPRRRADPLAKLHAWLTARHAFVQTAQRAKPEAGLRTLRAWGKRHKLDAFVHVSLHEGQLTALLDTTAQAEVARLAGCDVLETDVHRPPSTPNPSMTATA